MKGRFGSEIFKLKADLLQEAEGSSPLPHTALTYLRAFFRATKQRTKNTAPNANRTKRENHGKPCPSAEARRHMHACVSGDKYKAILNAAGIWFKEKNVPLRKDIGKITKLIKRVMS